VTIDLKTLTVRGLSESYRQSQLKPEDVVAGIFAMIKFSGSLGPVWISLADEEEAIRRATAWDPDKPLAGIPFAVKDNMDVEGMPTTAGCPSFAYVAKETAATVKRLIDAGAILIGKTNMDQFATGLVGTRSPFGACSSVFDDRYISGGSSSGSAVALAQGLCAFSLGTDTAGSGRVPAAFNGLIGFKPTRGTISTEGVIPACRSLDCVSIFTHTAEDAELVWRVARVDPGDERGQAPVSHQPRSLERPWRFGVPPAHELKFFGNSDGPALFRAAIRRLEALGGTPVVIDFSPFKEAASLLYEGPWVAERFAAVGEFLASEPPDADPIVSAIILSGQRYTASDVFNSFERLDDLKAQAELVWREIDVLLLPTTGTIYTKTAVAADPIGLNTNLGYYTNFVNLMDLAAVALPAGTTRDDLPFGVSLIGRSHTDGQLLDLAARYGGERQTPAPNHRHRDYVPIAVVGAHLSGQPLNWQLTDCRGRLVYAGRTTNQYQLFELTGSKPAKPGLMRSAAKAGSGIEVEVWELPREEFGSFVDDVPPPLAIGNVELSTGTWVKGFVCEPYGLEGARDITEFGGWVHYLSQRSRA
jgi:allophanate hydrolase